MAVADKAAGPAFVAAVAAVAAAVAVDSFAAAVVDSFTAAADCSPHYLLPSVPLLSTLD